MIINFPTGLYEDAGQIPVAPTDSGNITFTISSNSPKRSQQAFLQLPPIEELRKHDLRIFSDKERRLASDDLIYSFSTGNIDRSGSNTKLFEIGQILEFADSKITEEVNLDTVLPAIDIQHNTNLLDLSKAGLSDNEINFITDEAAAQLKELETQYVTLQIDIAGLESDVVEVQKQINEAIKIKDAISNLVISDQSILDKIDINLEILFDERLILVNTINKKKQENSTIFDSILKISELVR